MDLKVLLEEIHGTPVLVTLGEVDRGTVAVLDEHLAGTLATTPPAVVVDLSRLRFMDSTGVHAVLRAQQHVAGYGGQLAVVTGSGPVRQVFALCGAPVDVPLHATREQAAAFLAGSTPVVRYGSLETT